jgi:DNA topoisomerase-1
MKLPQLDSTSLRVAARYKSKKKIKTESGEDMTVYEYSDRQIANRNKAKADRVEKLRTSMGKLRTKVKSDLKKSDLKTKLTALAVALIDHTYERVGNDDSADEGHFGVTGWQRGHISFGKGSASIKYVGKSGVKHEKKVSDGEILKALRAAYDGVKGDKTCIFEHEGACITSKEVNAYLKDFDITAKDIRGLHANREVQDRLKKIRSAGPKLPVGRKDKDKILKAEFKKAIEEAAEAVGHEPSTLRSQYLVPSLEEAYLKDGSVIEKLNEKVASFDCTPEPPLLFANRIIRQLVDHMLSEDLITEEVDFHVMRLVFRQCGGSWEQLLNGSPVQNELLKTVVTTWGKMPGRKSGVEKA